MGIKVERCWDVDYLGDGNCNEKSEMLGWEFGNRVKEF